MLECVDLTQRFGGTVALSGVSLSIGRGEIVGVIGPNGSGKSTLVNVITGFYRPTSGSVRLDDTVVSGTAPHKVSRRGITRTFQNLRLFDDLTVVENVMIGMHVGYLTRRGSSVSWLKHALGTRSARASEAEARERALRSLETAGLTVDPDSRVTDLSYGQKKRLEIARAMVAEPQLLLLDEPTAGLSPGEADAVRDVFEPPVRERGLGILLIEHRLDWVLACADRVVVLNAGAVIADGLPDQIASNAEVVKVYVGG